MAICVVCERVTGFLDIRDGMCGACRREDGERAAADAVKLELQALERNRTADVSTAALDEAASSIMMTTGFDIPGQHISDLVEIVGAEVALSTNVFKDIANEWRDFVGGRSGAVQETLRQARTYCLAELKREAYRLGAEAVIAVRFEYSEASTRGTSGGIMFVVATGTAVRLAD